MVGEENAILERRNKVLRRNGILSTYKDWIAHSASKIWINKEKEHIEELYSVCVQDGLIADEIIYQSIGKGICHAVLHKDIYADGCSEMNMGLVIKQMLATIEA